MNPSETLPEAERAPILRFEGPFHLAGNGDFFSTAVSSQAGVYLWTVPYDNGGFLITYIGETITSFGQRTKEHMIQTLGGNYRVSDPLLLRQGIDRVLWNGLWRKGERHKIAEFVERYEEFAPAVKASLELARLFVAPLDVDKRTLKRVEGAIATNIRGEGGLSAALLPADIRYLTRRKDEVPMLVRIEAASHIHGLPSEVTA